jgi:hypothetical protein
MGKLEQFEVDGQTIWVEVADLAATRSPASKLANTSANGTAPSDKVTQAVQSVDLVAPLKIVANSVHKALEALQPDEVTTELSLGFKADVGVFVASSEASAQVKITMKWKKKGPNGDVK